jgi:hypothetical protein
MIYFLTGKSPRADANSSSALMHEGFEFEPYLCHSPFILTNKYFTCWIFIIREG